MKYQIKRETLTAGDTEQLYKQVNGRMRGNYGLSLQASIASPMVSDFSTNSKNADIEPAEEIIRKEIIVGKPFNIRKSTAA